MNKREEEALEFLGQEARDAYEGKIPEWEKRPECVEDSWWYEWCDECNTYHKSAYERGFSVMKGSIEEVFWNCDEDGNWDVIDSVQLDDPDYETKVQEYSSESWQENYNNYLRHVVDTGEDPCGEFFISKSQKVNEKWSVRVFDVTGGVALMAAQNGPDGQWTTVVPKHVQDYLMLTDGDPPLVAPEEYRSVEQLQKASGGAGTWRKVEIQRDDFTVIGVDEFDVVIERDLPFPEQQVKEELQVRARQALSRR